jgi:hypothetical protein
MTFEQGLTVAWMAYKMGRTQKKSKVVIKSHI